MSYMGIQNCNNEINRPCFIIAEAGVNHNGRFESACQLIDVAVVAGASAVKFQTFKAEKLIAPEAPKANYQIVNTGNDQSQLEMVRQLELSYDDFRRLFDYCEKQQIMFMSTPFDEESADFLDQLGMEIYKISSGEVTNLPFLRHIAKKGRPIILSTGMSTLGEIESAVQSIVETGNEKLSLLHCVSNYPVDFADVNLRAMRTMEMAFGYPVGLSDHTLGVEVPIAAVALGATIIEKHFTLDREMIGPDHRASLEPNELTTMVRTIRNVEMALGDGRKLPKASEINTAQVARRSLFVAESIFENAIITPEAIVALRPGTGISPALLPLILGRRARYNIAAGTMLSLDMLI